MGNDAQRLEEEKFQLRWQSKQLKKQSGKFEKEYESYKKKAAKAMEKGMLDVAKIHCQTAIHKRSMGNKTLAMASRLDAVEMRLTSSAKMQELGRVLAKTSDKMGSMITDESLTKMQMTMDKFADVFEDVDLKSQAMEQAMESGTSSQFNTNQVDSLLKDIAEENAMDVEKLFLDAGEATEVIRPSEEAAASHARVETAEEKELTERLAALAN